MHLKVPEERGYEKNEYTTLASKVFIGSNFFSVQSLVRANSNSTYWNIWFSAIYNSQPKPQFAQGKIKFCADKNSI